MTQPISYKIAELEGFKKDAKSFLRPQKNSDIAECFGHSKDHNQQAFVKPANKPETPAFVCGGSSYTLLQFATTLGYSLDDFKESEPQPTPLTPSSKKQPPPQQFYKQHSKKTPLKGLDTHYFKYFLQHGIKDSKTILTKFGAYLTVLNGGEHKGKNAFVFPLPNGSFKFFILDSSFEEIDKRTNAGGTDTLFPSKQHDLGSALYIFEGFPDCLKARELGYNAFTWSGGVRSFQKLALEFEPQREVFLVLDQDHTSQDALPKIAEAFFEEGFQVKVVDLPFAELQQGKDFCDWMKTHTKSEFDLLLDSANLFSKAQEELQELEEPLPIPFLEKLHLPPSELPEIVSLVKHLKKQGILFFQAPTGLGKTHALIQALLSSPQKRFVFFCSTNQEAMEVYQKACFLLKQSASLETPFLLTSLEGVSQKKAIEGARLVITNYGYLGRQGMTCKKHPYIEVLLKGRVVICDEVQELYKKMKVFHPLTARYLKKIKEFTQVQTCPKSSRKGDCSTCFSGYLRREQDQRSKEADFFKTLPLSSFQELSQQTPLPWELLHSTGFSSWEDLHNPKNYVQAQGTLYLKGLPSNLNSSKEDAENDTRDDSETYLAFLKSLLTSLKNPQIRLEFPLVNDSGVSPKEALQASKEEAQFPIKPCTIPILCGLDTWPLWQLFKYADSVIFTSATIPKAFHQTAKEIAQKKGWDVLEKEATKPPFQFDATLLKTEVKLGSKNLVSVLKALENRDEKVLVVLSRKSEALEAYKLLKTYFPTKVEYFESQDFEQEKALHPLRAQEPQQIKYLVTYAKSAITRGISLPDVNLVLVECDQFIPQAALGTLKEEMSTKEKKAELAKDILENLTQICGRVLRSNLKRELGQTLKDPRKLIFLLYSLPKETQAFTLDTALTFKQREFSNFVRTRKRGEVESISEAISLCLDGETPKEFSKEKIKKEVAENYKKGGNEKLAPKDRKFLSYGERDSIKLEEKKKKLIEKIKVFVVQGFDKRTIQDKLNLRRLARTDVKLFLEISNFLDECL
jgi:Rad3-related DNA helicase